MNRPNGGPVGPCWNEIITASCRGSTFLSKFLPCLRNWIRLIPTAAWKASPRASAPILDLALQQPTAITFDLEHYELKELTYEIFTRTFSEPAYREYPWAGIALQTYLRDAATTLDRLANWVQRRRTPIAVRLVKGAYWDAEHVSNEQRGWPIPVLTHKAETDANFERLSRTLLTDPASFRPAFGTHNVRSLAHAEAVAQSQRRPPESYEYQSLYGMADALQKAVVNYGRRVRVYAPVGETHSRHGLSGSATVRKHLERIGAFKATRSRGIAGGVACSATCNRCPGESRALDGRRRTFYE